MTGNFYARYPSQASTGVTSLDGLIGALNLVAGTGITIADNTPSAGDITISATGSGGSNVIEQRTITSGEAATKTLTLTGTPVGPIALLPTEGPAQRNTTDFTVTGNIVSWSGLGLDAIGVSAGDVWIIEYNT